jgi:hypothetical protein
MMFLTGFEKLQQIKGKLFFWQNFVFLSGKFSRQSKALAYLYFKLDLIMEQYIVKFVIDYRGVCRKGAINHNGIEVNLYQILLL